jgi:hypothetical protein
MTGNRIQSTLQARVSYGSSDRVREFDEDERPDIQRIVSLRQDGRSWQQTSDAMFELECQRLGKKPTLMAPRKWTVWRCREAVKVWQQVQTEDSASDE